MFFKKPNPEKAELEALGRSQAVIRFTPDGTILDANKNFLDVMGYTLGEVVGQHHRMFCDPAYTQSPEYRDFWRKLAAGEFFSARFKRIAKGGKEVWIEASYNPVLDDTGKVTGVVKYAKDITELQLQFADYEGQLEAISRSQAVIQFDLNGKILTANENFCATLGYKLDEIVGKHHSMFVDPAYVKTAEYNRFWERLKAGEYFVAEYQRFGKGGKEVWISASYNAIMDRNGRPFKVVKYATDITAQKMAAADARGQLDAISKSQAVIEFNLYGTIITANHNFLSALGYTLDEVRGRHHSMFVDPVEVSSHEYAAFWQRLGRGEYDARVYKRITKSGKEIWIQASYNPILDANMRPCKVVKFATDVTPVIQTGRVAEETVANTQGVAAAVEEMTASIGEISKNVQMSKDAAYGILQDSANSSDAADQLNSSMKVMENIVALIDEIAEQVNLLALNATIEAARAGDAGKGFAVVANEVKNLANQTTKATEDIARQIQEVQTVSRKVSDSIQTIANSVDNVNHYISGVASAIEEQTAVTMEISSNTQTMARAIEDVAQRIRNLSAVK